MDLISLSLIAQKAAVEAGSIIQSFFLQEPTTTKKNAGSSPATQIVSEADFASEKIILTHLEQSIQDYDLGLLTEEQKDDKSRFQKNYFWCIDPLDGTLPFVKKRPGYSVSIALVANEGIALIGVVYNPITKTLYHAVKGNGAFKDGKSLHPDKIKPFLSFYTDKKLIETPRSNEISHLLDAQTLRLSVPHYTEVAGSGAVMNAIHVLENGPACMFKFPKKERGGGALWDYAATCCIFNELGLTATTYDGLPIDLNKKEVYMNKEGVYFGNM